jgi:hypothetical protein
MAARSSAARTCALLLASALLQSWLVCGMGNDYDMPKPCKLRCRNEQISANYDVRLVMVEIEEIPIEIHYGELPQSPRLQFQRVDDVRA